MLSRHLFPAPFPRRVVLSVLLFPFLSPISRSVLTREGQTLISFKCIRARRARARQATASLVSRTFRVARISLSATLAERQVAVSLCRLNCFEEARLLFIHRETTVLEINGTIQGPRERSLLGAFETPRESLTMVHRCWRRSGRGDREEHDALLPRNSEDPHNATYACTTFPPRVLWPASNYRSRFGIPSCERFEQSTKWILNA